MDYNFPSSRKPRWRGADWKQEKVNVVEFVAGSLVFIFLAVAGAWILP